MDFLGEHVAEALRDADAGAELAEAQGHVALLETSQGALQRLFESERAKPSYLVKLKPEFGHLPDYKGRIEVGRTYRAFFSPDHADFMSLVGTDMTHAQKRHFEIRPDTRAVLEGAVLNPTIEMLTHVRDHLKSDMRHSGIAEVDDFRREFFKTLTPERRPAVYRDREHGGPGARERGERLPLEVFVLAAQEGQVAGGLRRARPDGLASRLQASEPRAERQWHILRVGDEPGRHHQQFGRGVAGRQ